MKKKIILSVAVAAVVLCGCKPTEKNYRAAYDAAVGRRSAEQAALAADGLITEDAPRPIYMDGDTLYFANEIISLDDDPKGGEKLTPLNNLNVALAMFKMSTNARSGAKALRSKGIDARAAKAVGDKWYIIGGSYENLDDARAFMKDFKAQNPDYPYIGLNGNPVIIRN